MEITTKNAKETYQLGFKIGSLLKELQKEDSAFTIGLEGDLGSGKTTFVQGLSQGLGIHTPIPSPTFTIVRQYAVNISSPKQFHHIDLYRLDGNIKEIKNLGLDDIFSSPSNIVAVEWAGSLKDNVSFSLYGEFRIKSESIRTIHMTSNENSINKLLKQYGSN